MIRSPYSVCGAMVVVLVASGCSKPADSELLLNKARRLVHASPDGAALTSLRTLAECDGPGGSWATEMRSSADGRALMQQRYPDGFWTWLQMEPDGGTTQTATSPVPAPLDAKWRSFVLGHELHFAALALDSRHEDLQLESGTSFEGQAADALMWVDELGGENRSFYRAADALPLGLELTNHLGDPPQVTVRFSDWPEEGEHRLFRAATIVHGGNAFHFRFHVIDVNPPLDSLYVAAPERVSFSTEDGGVVHADLYGQGDHGVVLAHGGRFTKESWRTQAEALAYAGFQVLAFDFRGRGESRGGPQPDSEQDVHLDVLAAVRYLHQNGARSVSVVGASFGGWAAARASVLANDGEIDGMILLAASSIKEPEGMKGRKLFITTRDDPRGEDKLRLPQIQEQYERAPEPKQLVILEGSAHAQFVFDTDQGERLMDEIVQFLSEP